MRRVIEDCLIIERGTLKAIVEPEARQSVGPAKIRYKVYTMEIRPKKAGTTIAVLSCNNLTCGEKKGKKSVNGG